MVFTVLVKFTAKPGEGDVLAAALLEGAAQSVANEPGCHSYRVLRPVDGGEVIRLVESYGSRADFEAHLTTAHYTVIRAALDRHLAAPAEVEFLQALN